MLSALERKVLVDKESRGTVEMEAQLYEVCLTWSLGPRPQSTLTERPSDNPELGVFKVTPGQVKPPSWRPCTPCL